MKRRQMAGEIVEEVTEPVKVVKKEETKFVQTEPEKDKVKDEISIVD